jgi:hypothetical protein
MAMYERATEVLSDKDLPSDSFRMQFAVYRNYNSEAHKLLEQSSWATRPEPLHEFLARIEVEGGWGSEAIEIALWHAANEADKAHVSQVILIGDAPGNTDEMVIAKRNTDAYSKGELYWSTSPPYNEPTFQSTELGRLKAKGIPVSAFYVSPWAESAFQHIASETGGECAFLDVNGVNGAALLRDFVTRAILNNVGGADRGAELVQAYDLRFVRGHSRGGHDDGDEAPIASEEHK